MSFWICETCAVEHAEKVEVCSICADERQWVPAEGQRWTSLEELAESGHRVEVSELEPDLFGIASTPVVGIGHQSKLVRTPAGNLLWDPIGYLDDEGIRTVRSLGEVTAIVASHPHMFGAQVEWSRSLGGAPVLVAAQNADWVARTQPGGHFPGSAVVHWSAGAEGKGVLLSSDTIFANPDRDSVSFMRSFPNRLPLSGEVVERITRHVEAFTFDRLYGNFDIRIDTDARAVVRRSADRHIGWGRGDFDHLT